MWIKLDDQMLDNPKIAAAGPIGFALHVAGIIYSARNLTDGFVPYGHARKLLATDWAEGDDCLIWRLSAVCGMHGEDGDSVIEHVIRLLCDLGLWESVARGYLIHDYLDYNPSRDQVLAMRAERQEAGRKGGLAKAKANALAKSWQNSAPHPASRTRGVENPSSVGSSENGYGIQPRGWRGEEEGVGAVLGRLAMQSREAAK